MNMNVFNTAKRLFDAYGTSSWRRAMRIKRRACDCKYRDGLVVPTHGNAFVCGLYCCRTFRFWSHVEGLLDSHRYGDATGSGGWTRRGDWGDA
jgi:hypothetical protein